jgi:TRAP-type C4-dicarboxylate transport system permease small subunit
MVNYAILTVFLTYIVGAGLWISYVSRERAFQGIPAISYSWVTLSLPVGGALLLISTIIKIRREIKWGGGE